MTPVLLAADLLATLLLAPFFLLLASIATAAVAGRVARRRPAGGPAGARPRFLVVIPAHDEEDSIEATVRSCLAVDYPRDRLSLWVIADNCSDATADRARAAGASVVERSAPDLRSKGHALEYFFSRVPEGRPEAGGYDAAVLVDADTSVDPGLLRAFEAALAEGKDWIQGYYTVRNPDASWRTRLMTYAFSLANGVWMAGLERLGLGVGLKGNGMCFSAAGLRRAPWRAYGLVEDMEFALMLKARGERVRFVPEARVFGEMVSRGGPGAASQRRRWEAGRRALRGKFAGPLARSASLGPYRKALGLLELYFPPLVTLGLGLMAALGIDGLAVRVGPASPVLPWLITIHASMVATLAFYGISPIIVMELPPRYLASLAYLPYYAGWKLLAVIGRKPKAWVRTPRETPTSP